MTRNEMAPDFRAITEAATEEGIRWLRVNEEPYEYAIQEGLIGDEFVKLLNGTCLRRAIAKQDQ